MLEQGVHPKVVQERLGHVKITTTLDTLMSCQAYKGKHKIGSI